MATIENELASADVRITAIRLLVYKEIKRFDSVFSLVDLGNRLPTLDKSTLFRTLRLFLDKKILHEINDGSGFKKYCLCHSFDVRHMSHVHFTCVSCGSTFCIKDVSVPQIQLPDSFRILDANYVLKGFCSKCK